MSYQQSGIDESLKAAIERGDKWKSLARELTKVMQLVFEEWPEKITPCHRQMETMLDKAREAGL